MFWRKYLRLTYTRTGLEAAARLAGREGRERGRCALSRIAHRRATTALRSWVRAPPTRECESKSRKSVDLFVIFKAREMYREHELNISRSLRTTHKVSVSLESVATERHGSLRPRLPLGRAAASSKNKRRSPQRLKWEEPVRPFARWVRVQASRTGRRAQRLRRPSEWRNPASTHARRAPSRRRNHRDPAAHSKARAGRHT